MTLENPTIDHSEEETPRQEIDFENGWKESIKERIQKIKDAKAKLEELRKQAEVWRDFSPHSQDNTDIDKLVQIIEEEKKSVLEEINLRFEILIAGVMLEEKVKSESGKTYTSEAVAKTINDVSEAVSKGYPNETILHLIKYVTRTNKLNSNVSEVVDLFLEINK